LWYHDISNGAWKQDLTASTWTYYPPVSSTRRRSTPSSRRYRTGQFGSIPPEDSILYPTTVLPQQSGYFSVVTSDSPFGDEPLPAPPDLWHHAITPEALANTPPFFQHLLSNPLSSDECQIIASEIQDDHLCPKLVMVVCMLVISSRKPWLVGLVQWTAILPW